MPQGLQVFDALGAIVLDTTDRTFKGVTTATVTEGTPTSIPISKAGVSTSAFAMATDGDLRDPSPILSLGATSIGVSWSDTGSKSRSMLIMEY